MKRFAPVAIVLLLLGAFLFWWFSPVQVVKRRTATLLEVLTMDAAAGSASRQAGVYSLNALLAREVELDTPTIPEANGSFDREELESAYSWLGRQARFMDFKLLEMRDVTVTGDEALVEFTLDAVVELANRRPVDGRFDVTFRWQREERVWRLAAARWDDTP